MKLITETTMKYVYALRIQMNKNFNLGFYLFPGNHCVLSTFSV
jgi:hypothetical protein